MKHIAIFDDQVTGHHFEFLAHLRAGVSRVKVTFVVPAEMSDKLGVQEEEDGPNIVSSLTLPQWNDSSQIKKKWKQGKWLAEQAEFNRWTHVFFMNLDPYQHVIGARLVGSKSLAVGGILFSPPHRLNAHPDTELLESVTLKVRRWRKFFQLRFALTNPFLKHVFLLDDKKGVAELNRIRNVFRFLADPIPELPEKIENNYYQDKLGIPSTEKVLLVFGSVIPRKNIDEVITAFKNIKSKNVHLVIIGRGRDDYANKIKEIILQLPAERAEKIHFPNEFVDYEEVPAIFKSADVVIMVYKNFYGSSGVLGHAASAKKPVIVAKDGLVSELVNQYGLGVCVDSNVESVAKGINDVLAGFNMNMNQVELYLSDKKPAVFKDRIFSFCDDGLIHVK